MGIINVCCFRPASADAIFEHERVRPKVTQTLIAQARTALDSYDRITQNFDRSAVGHAYSALGHRLRLDEPAPGEPGSAQSISAPLHPDDRSDMLALHKQLEDLLMKRSAPTPRPLSLQRAVTYPHHILPSALDQSEAIMHWARFRSPQATPARRQSEDVPADSKPADQSELRPLRREMSLPSRERLDVALQLHLSRAQAAAAVFSAAEKMKSGSELPVSQHAEDAQLQSTIEHYQNYNCPT